MNDLVKQAYVQGLAARAILRARVMEKVAETGAAPEPTQPWLGDGGYVPGFWGALKGRVGDVWKRSKTPLKWGGGGAAVGAGLGALIAHARKKNLLRGALIGGGIGGIAGLGANELRDLHAHAKENFKG